MTITEIAKLAGVSIGTVDRVLHGRGRFSKETARRVRKIAEQYNYQPDPFARQLKKHTPYKIGFLFPSLLTGSGYWNKVFDGAEKYIKRELSAFSISLVPFFFDRNDNDSLSAKFFEMIESDAAAYVIAPVMQEKIYELLTGVKNLKPYCLVDTSIKAFETDGEHENAPLCVIAQNPYRAGLLSGKLTELLGGKRGNFAVIEVYGGSYNLSERSRGFCDWFSKNGGKQPAHIVLDSAVNTQKTLSVKSALDELFASQSDISGICTVSVEVQLVAEYIAERGIENVAVTGFDLIDENERLLRSGKISCLIDQEPEEQGRLAMHQLYRHLIFGENAVPKIDIPIDIYFKENLPEMA